MEFSAKLKGFVTKLKIWAKKFTPVGSQTLKKQAWTNDTNKLQLSATNSVKDAIHLASRKKLFQVQNLGNNLLDYVGNRSQKAHTKNVRYSTIQHSLFNGFIMEEDHWSVP